MLVADDLQNNGFSCAISFCLVSVVPVLICSPCVSLNTPSVSLGIRKANEYAPSTTLFKRQLRSKNLQWSKPTSTTRLGALSGWRAYSRIDFRCPHATLPELCTCERVASLVRVASLQPRCFSTAMPRRNYFSGDKISLKNNNLVWVASLRRTAFRQQYP